MGQRFCASVKADPAARAARAGDGAGFPTYLEAVLDYVYGSGGDSRARSVDALTHLLMDALPDKRRDIMTFAEQLEQRGREKGWQEGKKAEARAIAQSMLAEGSDLAFIKKVTRLSDEEIIALMH